jgi:hypothetical protein
MESLFRLRQFLVVVAVMGLAACNAAQNLSPNVGAGSNSRLGPTRVVFNHKENFTAAYSGTYSEAGDCSATATFTYEGRGKTSLGKFLNKSSQQISAIWYCGSQDLTGSATLTSTRFPGASITASVSSSDFDGPCYGFTMSFKVTGGTGRFLGASGGGTIVVKRHSRKCISYRYSDKWSGTLKL